MVGLTLTRPLLAFNQEVTNVRPLVTGQVNWRSILPPDTHLLIESTAMEQFLEALDGTPPDWIATYGQGHRDPGLDDRLFELNRARDAKREGKPLLERRITFVWHGELSSYDSMGGFRVAVGPEFTGTRWGTVRFKPQDLPPNLTAITDSTAGQLLRHRMEQGEHVEVDVVLTGRLVPQESLVYDFSHDEEGGGVIMPVVRIERIDFALVR